MSPDSLRGQLFCLHESLGEQRVRTRVTERYADTNFGVAKRGRDWGRTELVLDIEATDERGRVYISVTCQRWRTLLLSNTDSSHVNLSHLVQ